MIPLFTAGRCAQPEHVERSAGHHISPERERWHTWPRYTARSVFDGTSMTSEPGLSAVMGGSSWWVGPWLAPNSSLTKLGVWKMLTADQHVEISESSARGGRWLGSFRAGISRIAPATWCAHALPRG